MPFVFYWKGIKLTLMKKRIQISVLLIFALFITSKAQNLRTIHQTAFKAGEKLEFTASYGFVDAARVSLIIQDSTKKIGSRQAFHVVGKGVSLGAFNWFFKVNDRYETYIDDQAIIPWVFIRRVQEGGYTLKRNIYFNQYNNKAIVKSIKDGAKTTYVAEPNAQDLLSALYYARTLDLQNAKVGDEFTIPTFFDQENYPMKIKFLGKEVVKTALGKTNCLKFSPLLQEGRVFKEKEDMTIWISDDQNKVPIRLKTNLLIGSLKLDLEKYSGLMAPLNLVK